MDEQVDLFVSVTGASPDVARRYLGMTDNPEQAIQLFFESPDLASSVGQGSQIQAPPIPTSTHPQRAASGGRQDERGVVHTDSEEEDMDVDDDELAASRAAAVGRVADYEDDEAMARRMQEELYASGGGDFGADGVRAPMARTTETLVGGPGGDWPPDDMNAAILQQMRARRQPRPGGMFQRIMCTHS